MLILNIINYVKIQVIMMQDNLMLLIIKAFSSFKFTFIISLFYMKLYKLSIEFATKTKKKIRKYIQFQNRQGRRKRGQQLFTFISFQIC